MNLTWKVHIQALNQFEKHTEHYISTEELMLLIEIEKEGIIWKFEVVSIH